MKISDLKAIVISAVTSDGSQHEFEMQMVTKTYKPANPEKEKFEKETPNATSPNGGFLTVKQVAERFRVNPFTVYSWASSGRLPCHRLSKRALRFLESDIEKYLKNHKTGR